MKVNENALCEIAALLQRNAQYHKKTFFNLMKNYQVSGHWPSFDARKGTELAPYLDQVITEEASKNKELADYYDDHLAYVEAKKAFTKSQSRSGCLFFLLYGVLGYMAVSMSAAILFTPFAFISEGFGVFMGLVGAIAGLVGFWKLTNKMGMAPAFGQANKSETKMREIESKGYDYDQYKKLEQSIQTEIDVVRAQAKDMRQRVNTFWGDVSLLLD